MNNVRCVWVLPFVVASICVAGASSAFAQGTGYIDRHCRGRARVRRAGRDNHRD